MLLLQPSLFVLAVEENKGVPGACTRGHAGEWTASYIQTYIHTGTRSFHAATRRNEDVYRLSPLPMMSDMQKITANQRPSRHHSFFIPSPRRVRETDLLETCWQIWRQSVTAARIGLGLELGLHPRDDKPLAIAPFAALLLLLPLQLLPSNRVDAVATTNQGGYRGRQRDPTGRAPRACGQETPWYTGQVGGVGEGKTLASLRKPG